MNQVFKYTVLWSAWTPLIATRIMRDILDLQRLARTKRATFVVAADEPLASKVEALGIMTSSNFNTPAYTRVYLVEGFDIPEEIADRICDESQVDVISINALPGTAPKLVVDKDPYAGVQFYQSWRRIPSTMPLNQKAPPSNLEPMMSPLL